jgi:hypothetical protein
MLKDLFRKKTPAEVLFESPQPSGTKGDLLYFQDGPDQGIQAQDPLQNLFGLLRLLTEESSPQALLTDQQNFLDLETQTKFLDNFQSATSNEGIIDIVENFITKYNLSPEDISKLIAGSPAAKEKIIAILKTKSQEDPDFKKNVLLLLNYLLLIDAELEQQLMLQYLYAGYSIDTEPKDTAIKPTLLAWQQQFISIAREEMGHLITVQNVRKSLGWGIYFNIETITNDTTLFPYTADLEPLSINSLAKYIYAESPPNWINSQDKYAVQIKEILDKLIHKNTQNNVQNLDQYIAAYGVPISVLFKIILFILQELTDEKDFLSQSVPQQAHPDQWNRGYTSEERTININGKSSKMIASNVLVERVMTRWECIQAIEAIAEQGENADESTIDTNKFTHFNRFLDIFKTWESETKTDFRPSKNMATNPRVNPAPNTTHIEDPNTIRWAKLLNIRYNLLLTFIEHSFDIENNFSNPSSSLRGLIINGSFGEMYNLKAISNVLSTLKISKDKDLLAGPPFEIRSELKKEYSKQTNRLFSNKDKNYVDLYLKLIKETKAIAQELLKDTKENPLAPFLVNLQNNDQELLKMLSPQK